MFFWCWDFFLLHCGTHGNNAHQPCYLWQKCFQLDVEYHHALLSAVSLVNRDLGGLHVLYLITDRVGHLGHQSEYLNTYKIGFSLTASLRLIKFGLPEHRSSVKHIMHLPCFRWKSFSFHITANDILTWAGCKFLLILLSFFKFYCY